MQLTSTLSSARLFHGLDQDQLETLIPAMELQPFLRNEQLWMEGEASGRLAFITQGRVKLVKHRANGRDLIVDILGPGTMWGMIDGGRQGQPLSVIGLEQGCLATIDRAVLFAVLRQHSAAAFQLTMTQIQEYRSLLERFEEVTAGSVEARLTSLFLRLAHEEGKKTSNGIAIYLPLSRQDLADLVDTTIETAIRVMSRWNRERVLLTLRSGFLIPDLGVLEDRVEAS